MLSKKNRMGMLVVRGTILSLLLRIAYARQCNLQFNFALLLVAFLCCSRTRACRTRAYIIVNILDERNANEVISLFFYSLLPPFTSFKISISRTRTRTCSCRFTSNSRVSRFILFQFTIYNFGRGNRINIY